TYLEGRPFVPRGKAFQEAVERWKTLRSDDGARFDMTVELHAEQIAPQVTWGTNPGMVTSVTARVPDPHDFKDLNDQKATESALKCIGMNADVLPPHERSASTSNRNFEGRQGKDSRTHLVSPVMAAAAAIAGHFVDVRSLDGVAPVECLSCVMDTVKTRIGREHQDKRLRVEFSDGETAEIKLLLVSEC